MSTLDNVLLVMDFILEQFEQFKKRYKTNKTIRAMFNSGWMKIKKYYKMTNKSLAYIAALVCNTRYGRKNYVTSVSLRYGRKNYATAERTSLRYGRRLGTYIEGI